MSEFVALATALMSLAAAVAYGLWYSSAEHKGLAGAAVKTASTGLLALAVLLSAPDTPWFWLIPVGLAFGALGDLFLALKGERFFLAGVAAFGLGHVAYAGAFLLRAQTLGFDGLSIGEGAVLAALLGLLVSTEVWLAPRAGGLRWPVRIYVGLIGLMGIAAILLPSGPGLSALRVGALFFVASDLMLSIQLFVTRDDLSRRRLGLTLWPTYWVAQALIALGALGYWGQGPI